MIIFRVVFYLGLVVKGVAAKWWLDLQEKRGRGDEETRRRAEGRKG